jgi:hypothetical protein
MEGFMKKAYRKPAFERRDLLSAVVAVASNIVT